MNNLIEERDERTERRKKYKRKVDRMFNLSYKDEETIKLTASVKKLSDSKIRLLDEGAIVGDDYIDFIIKKGTLEKFVEGRNEFLPNLTEDFVGSVNLGHMDFATFPFIIGEWKKSDLSLVDIDEDGRKGIDVALHLDSESVFVQELQRQPYDIGISSEFYYHVDWEATDDVGYLVVDEVYIFAYGLVGECGNVNSSGLELKGEPNMAEDKKNLAAEVEEEVLEATEETEEVAEEVEELSVTEETEEAETAEEELVAEEAEEETIELSETDVTEAEDTDSEEVNGEEAELTVSDETEDDEADGMEEALAIVNELKETISKLTVRVESLEEANCKLKKTNKRLSAKLDDEKKKKEAFIESAKSISVKLGVNEDTKPKENKAADAKFAFGDGIGD